MQDVSGVHTSRFHDTDGLEMALQAKNVSGSFEKCAPGACFSKAPVNTAPANLPAARFSKALEKFPARRAKTKS